VCVIKRPVTLVQDDTIMNFMKIEISEGY
jgi:hypothetical protein